MLINIPTEQAKNAILVISRFLQYVSMVLKFSIIYRALILSSSGSVWVELEENCFNLT